MSFAVSCRYTYAILVSLSQQTCRAVIYHHNCTMITPSSPPEQNIKCKYTRTLQPLGWSKFEIESIQPGKIPQTSVYVPTQGIGEHYKHYIKSAERIKHPYLRVPMPFTLLCLLAPPPGLTRLLPLWQFSCDCLSAESVLLLPPRSDSEEIDIHCGGWK